MVIEMRRIDVRVDEANELLNQAGLASLNTMEILQGGWWSADCGRGASRLWPLWDSYVGLSLIHI